MGVQDKVQCGRFGNLYKARLVAKGYAQTHGIAYNETFALTTKMMMVRVVLGVVAARG